MKKVFYVGLAASMISLASCGGSDKSDASAADSKETTVESTEVNVSSSEEGPTTTSTESDDEMSVDVPDVDVSDLEDAANDIYEKSQKQAEI